MTLPPAALLPAQPWAPPSPGPDPWAGWHRLHPLSPLVRAGRGAVALLVVLLPTAFGGRRDPTALLTDAAGVGVLLVLGVISWAVTRWQVADGVLRVETGLLRRSSQRYPLTRVQAVDVAQTGLARVLGLAELRLRLPSGSEHGSGRLACLRVREAQALRARLLALAHGRAESSPAPPEQLLVALPTARLFASILLSVPGVLALVLVLSLVVLGVIDPGAASGALGGGAAGYLGIGTVLWRRFNGDARLRLAEAPDGLRLSSGLVQTTAETIPLARVQGVRLVEPLLWRPLGWCRLEAEVAGRRTRDEGQAEARRLRPLVPVGSRAQADAVLARVLPGAPWPSSGAPRRARWKAPLRYRNLAVGGDAHCLVSRGGRLHRVTTWVPLAKVQSIRRVQGPVQRRLGLATVHVDVAGRGVHAALRDRTVAEADAALAALPALCRDARRAAAPGPGQPGGDHRGPVSVSSDG